jgi:putative ATPase
MRPRCLKEFIGQNHLLAEGKPLYEAVSGRHLHSMVFWGPPGSGKTTLARLIATNADAEFIALSAVLSGVKEVRDAVARAKSALLDGKRQTL